MIAQPFRSRSSWHSSLALAACLFPFPASADDWPPPLYGPIEVADDSPGTPGDTRWPQLTSLGGGELALTFVRGGVDLSLARTSDGLDWRVVNESVEDVPPEVLAINQSAAVDIGGQLGVAWRYYDQGVTRMRFSVLDLEGVPVGPSTFVDDGIVPPESSRFVGFPVLLVRESGLIVVWPQILYGPQSIETAIRWSTSRDAGRTWTYPDGSLESEFIHPGVAAPDLAGCSSGTTTLISVNDADPGHIALHELGDGGKWKLRSVLPTEEGRAIRGYASIRAGRQGTCGVLATTARTPLVPPLAMAFWVSPDGGATWAEPVEVSVEVAPGNHYNGALAADSLGRWHAAWIHAPPFSSSADVHYARSTSGVSWTEPIRVNPTPGSVAIGSPHSVSIATDDQGEVYIAYTYGSEQPPRPEAIHVMTTRDRPYDPNEGVAPFTLSPLPNPFRGTTRLTMLAPRGVSADVRLFDGAGRLVREWLSAPIAGDRLEVQWAGDLPTGADAAAGVYFWDVRVDVGSEPRRAHARSVLVR